MQLVSYSKNNFHLGSSAMLVNEGLALYVYEKLEKKFGNNLKNKLIGLLGMAFKAKVMILIIFKL